MATEAYITGAVFDGETLREGVALLVDDGAVVGIAAEDALPDGATLHRLGPGVIAPGFVDLQVNGGDGVMFNDAPSVATLERMARAHLRLGTAALLPTLITDRVEVTEAAIAAGIAAVRKGVPGVLGLHLEGPHLSVARKGAHDPALIREMTAPDLDRLLRAAEDLPVLIVTVAPESVSTSQIAELADAGAVVSLGHTDADFDTCMAAFEAGARCVTHLFNAMSQLGNRAPGLVGAALEAGAVSAGMIADGIHVHPTAMRTALASKRGPAEIYLVTDAMAPAGTDQAVFELNGREITRRDGQLTLADGTLAGADLDFARAVEVLVGQVGVGLEVALRMATSGPADVIGAQTGRLLPGRVADFVWLGADWRLGGVWSRGVRI